VSAAIQARPSAAARIGRLIGIVLVFVVLGPPLGAVIWVAMVAGIGMPPEWDVAGPDPGWLNWLTLLGLVYAVPMSYFFGAGPAAAAGLAIGFWQSFIGRAGWPLALGSGLVVAIVVLERSGQGTFAGTFAGTPDQSPFPEYPAIMILACLIPTLLCWALVRSWYFAPPSPTGATP
jgi:hypothetical protein